MTNRISPYTRLKDSFHKFASNVCYPRKRHMWTYPKATLDTDVWALKGLWDRVAAAKTLGWDVVLEATDEGIKVYYLEARPTDIPWDAK